MEKQIFVIDSRGKAFELADRIARINPDNPEQPKYMITVEEYKVKRSTAQNRLYWKWLKEISEGYADSRGAHYADKVWHIYFSKEFLGHKVVEIRGEFITNVKSTTSLNTKEFTDYLEKIEYYSSSEMNIILTNPEDLYWAAMGLTQKREAE